MQLSSCTYRAETLDVARVRSQLWRCLQGMDGHLQDLPSTSGCGEAVGGHLVVRFASEPTDTLFACEVRDVRSGDWIELGFAKPQGQKPVAFWRRVGGGAAEDAPQPWTDVLAGVTLVPHVPKVTPTYQLMAGMLFAEAAPVALVENTEARALLEDDLDYWRSLARSQARAIERLRRPPAEESSWQVGPTGRSPAAAPAPKRQWTLRDLAEWAAQNEDRIIVLPRAVSATRKSDYRDATSLYAALELLAGTYRLVKLGQAPREQLKAEVDALRMEIRGSVEPTHARDEYFVRWAGRMRFLDQHLCKGVSRDQRFTLRVYFTWDDEVKKVVVGWCPGHLSNSMT